MKSNRWWPAIVALGCLCHPGFAQNAGEVASVNGKPITEKEFHQTLVDWFGRGVLEEMIQTAIIAQAAAANKVTVTDEQVQEQLATMQIAMDERAKAGQGEPFAAWLANRRLSLANLRQRLRTELLLDGLVADRVSVTAEDVSGYYDRNLKLFQEPTRVKISVISLKTELDAEVLREKILRGDITWADAFRDYNVNPITGDVGGQLGYRTEDGSPLSVVAFTLERDHDISDVVFFGGFHNIVRRDDRRNARTLPYEEVKDKIEAVLRDQQLHRAKNEMRTVLLNQARIQRLIEFPDHAPAPAAP